MTRPRRGRGALPLWALLVALSGPLAVRAVRDVLLYDMSNLTLAPEVRGAADGHCRVLHMPAGPGLLPGSSELLRRFDLVITDERSLVPWTEASGRFYFLEDRYFPLGDLARELAQAKEALPLESRRQGMSLLLPEVAHTQEIGELVQIALELMPNSVFVDKGTFESRRPAFNEFTFSALLNEELGTPPQTLVDCIAHGVVPMFVGTHHKLNYTRYFPYSVVKFKEFSVEFAINFMLTAPADVFYVYANSVKIAQEFFHMRYKSPFPQRLFRHATMACYAMETPAPPLVFLAIYSARTNFGRRMALRDTWLQLFRSSLRMPYKFFLADTSVDGSSSVDQLLRRERDSFDDMIFLAGTTDEYPIGRKGLAALKWAAHHTEAQFWLKMDDDVYVRPALVLDKLARSQRAEAYWGSFDYSGRVVRDPTHPHFTHPQIWADEVFPPYARGAALAISMDLVRVLVSQEERQPLKKIIVEDVSYGYYLWQLVFDRLLTSVTLLDVDEPRFAMDAKCCTEQTHPNNCWLPLTDGTWIVHHASPKIIRCMFATDLAAGMYVPVPPAEGLESSGRLALVSEMLPHDSNVRSAATPGAAAAVAPRPGLWEGPMPDLCGCVYTPPPHPGQPKQTGGPMTEFADGPRLYVD